MGKLDISFLGEPLRRKGSQLFFNCPFHEDEKGHLGVNVGKGIYHCFKCNAAGRIEELEAPLSKFKEKVESYLFGNPTKEQNTVEVKLPSEFIKLKPNSGLPYRYLRQRDVSDSEMDKYGIGYCSEGLYGGRIIIPIYKEGLLKYFVGRTYINRAPKYMNSPTPKDDVIFKTFDKRQNKAIVCEGIFDALRIGKVFPAISILGKVLNGSKQILEIVKATKEVYMMLDSDAEKDGFKAAMILNYYVPTRVMFIKAKDPGELSLKELKEMLP